MCNCLKKTTEKTIDFIKENFKKEGKKVSSYNEDDSGYLNRVLSFGSINGGRKLVMPFELKYTPIKANGTHGREATYKTSIFPTYCPFCGKKQSTE